MKKYSLYKFDFDTLPKSYHSLYPFDKDDVFVILGEISGMSGHCVVASRKTNLTYIGYHTDNFIKLKQEEL